MANIIGLLIMASVLYASWNLIPVFFNNYNFGDKVTELARAPKYSHPDERIMGRGCLVCHAQIHGSNNPSGSKFHE